MTGPLQISPSLRRALAEAGGGRRGGLCEERGRLSGGTAQQVERIG